MQTLRFLYSITRAVPLALALVLSLLPGARAQTAVDAPYRLGAGDVLSIQVINFPELSVPQVTVPPDGKITVPLLGSLPVTGRTTEDVAQTLTKRWGTKYVTDPSVTVSLTQRRREFVQFSGYVAHAQPVEYRPGLRLLDALAQVGGVAENGDITQVTVTHKGIPKQTVDLTDPQTKAGTTADLSLAADDIVYVPQRHTEITVLGEVTKPGSYDYKNQMTVLDALNVAGPINPETANLSGATLVHGGQESKLDLNALLRQGQMADNVILAPGDRIFVPMLYNRTYVAGAVGRPGYYTFKPGDRVIDALSGSGGTAQNADLAKVRVVHVDKLKNTATVQTLDLNKFYEKADMNVNVALAPGDVLYVPVKGQSHSFLESLTGVGAIASTVRILSGGLL